MSEEKKSEVEDAEKLVCGFWKSDKGECRIFADKITSQLSYEELIGDGSERLHGRLVPLSEDESEKNAAGVTCWEAELMILEEGQGPWYGPSCGPKPDVVGSIRLRLTPGSPPSMDTRIKVDGEEDWQDPTVFKPVNEE
eukprot:TRINITY_DN116990_c0_g1_i1.p1 TRINITY_DN116990_c0_g1~~TRINITY_DN116990_c0_g1_i1.p1  ORF type:complete len:163 (+),score=28.66 TRINITY_DN116990_c0_g1_i1:75-491(+)